VVGLVQIMDDSFSLCSCWMHPFCNSFRLRVMALSKIGRSPGWYRCQHLVTFNFNNKEKYTTNKNSSTEKEQGKDIYVLVSYRYK